MGGGVASINIYRTSPWIHLKKIPPSGGKDYLNETHTNRIL